MVKTPAVGKKAAIKAPKKATGKRNAKRIESYSS